MVISYIDEGRAGHSKSQYRIVGEGKTKTNKENGGFKGESLSICVIARSDSDVAILLDVK